MADNEFPPPAETKPGTGHVKAVIISIWSTYCFYMTPKLVGYLLTKHPDFLEEKSTFELVTACEGLITYSMIKWTPDYLLEGIIDAIKWCKRAWKKIRGACDEET